MSITKEDLRDFTRFADQKLENGGAATMSELVQEWESQRRSTPPLCVEIDAHSASVLAAAFPEDQNDEKLKQSLGRRDGITTAELLRRAASAAEKAGRG